MSEPEPHDYPPPRADPAEEPAEPWARKDRPPFDWDNWRREHEPDPEMDPEP